MAENRRGKESRFYFSRGQMILLGAAFALTSVIIFVLGVFVGKAIEGGKLVKKEEPLVRIPVNPSAQQSGRAPVAPSKDEITFNASLPNSSAAAASVEDKPGASKPAEKTGKLAARQDPGTAKGDTAAKASDKKTETTPRAEAPRKPEAAEPSEKKEQGKVWRAQVNAFPDERSAKQIVDRLKNKGYNAYVTEIQNRGKSWYRVSVGKYNSRDEADKMVEAMRTKENFPKAFAASR